MSEQFFYTGNLRNNTFDIDQIPNETNVSVSFTSNQVQISYTYGGKLVQLRKTLSSDPAKIFKGDYICSNNIVENFEHYDYSTGGNWSDGVNTITITKTNNIYNGVKHDYRFIIGSDPNAKYYLDINGNNITQYFEDNINTTGTYNENNKKITFLNGAYVEHTNITLTKNIHNFGGFGSVVKDKCKNNYIVAKSLVNIDWNNINNYKQKIFNNKTAILLPVILL